MTLYEWNDSYKVGNAFIDYDHKKLFQMIADFDATLDQDTAQSALGTVLHDLANYAQQHFTREEDEMLRLDANGFFVHKLEHKKFLAQVTDWQERHARGEFTSTLTVSSFLHDWLKNHVLKADQLLADAIRAAH